MAKKFGKITNISITVIFKDGKATGSPWFKTAKQAKNYMRRKINQMGMGDQVKTIYKYNWREGMTLDDVKRVKIKSL